MMIVIGGSYLTDQSERMGILCYFYFDYKYVEIKYQ